MQGPIYDPAFAVRPVPNHDGECQYKRFHRYLERCTLPGCPCGRVSRKWLSEMQRLFPLSGAN
jgi:hypothetical protein